MNRFERRAELVAQINSFGIALLIVGICLGGIEVVRLYDFVFFPSTTFIIATSITTLLVGLLARVLLGRKNIKCYSVHGSVAVLLLVLLSTVPGLKFGFAQARPYWLDLLYALPIAVIIVAWVKPKTSLILLLLTIIATTVLAFCIASGGNLLFSDDHPCFLYRLQQLKNNFPHIPFYNPFWNAGVEAREFFPSGVLNLYLLFWPIIELFSLQESYSYIVVSIPCFLLPLSIFFAAKLLKFSLEEALASSILSLAPSLLWFRWLFVYGTLGFSVSLCLMPIAFALIIRVWQGMPNSSWGILVTCVAIQSLCYLWSPSIIALLPIICLQLLILPKFVKTSKGTIFYLLLICCNLPWLIIFIDSSKVFSFLESNAEITSNAILNTSFNLVGKVTKSFRLLREHFHAANPVIVLLTLPGLILLRQRKHALIFSILLAWLLALAFLGPIIIKRLELERMYLTLIIFCCLLAGTAVAHLLGAARKGLNHRFLALIVITPLCALPLWSWRIYGNHSIERFRLAEPIVFTLSSAIDQYSRGGRVLFAGFVLHELSHGHFAPLAHFTKAQLIASNYQHSTWTYTDVIPKSFRDRGQLGVIEFLDLMNVSAVVTHDRFWRNWFKDRPQLFKRVWKSERFSIFERLDYNSEYFLSGQGEIIDQKEGVVSLRLNQPNAIIKFSFHRNLRSSCSILPAEVAPGVTLIELRACPLGEKIEIRSISPIWRLFEELTQVIIPT